MATIGGARAEQIKLLALAGEAEPAAASTQGKSGADLAYEARANLVNGTPSNLQALHYNGARLEQEFGSGGYIITVGEV